MVKLLLASIVIALYLLEQPNNISHKDRSQGHPDAKYARLSYGEVYYRLQGPKNGEKVVFCHGFSVGSERAWAKVSQLVAADGYRVLTFDLWGRGYSDSPNIKHTAAAFSMQLAELLLHIEEFRGKPFTLVGISMGGAITAKFTEIHPDLVKQLILIAPAGVGHVPTPLSVKFMALPLIGEAVLKFAPFLIENALRHHVDRAFANTHAVREHIEESKRQISEVVRLHEGFLPSLLSTTRNFELYDGAMEPVYENIGRHHRKTKILWGDRDIVVPFENSAALIKLMPNATLVKLPDVGHSVPEEFPELVYKEIVAMMRNK